MNMNQKKEGGGENIRTAASAAVQKAAQRLREVPAARFLLPAGAGVAAAMLSAAEVYGGIYPFGAAMLCAAKGFTYASAVFCGAVIGSSFIRDYPLQHILLLLLIYCVRLALGGIEKGGGIKQLASKAFGEDVYVKITLSAAAAVAAGAFTVLGGENIYYDVTAALAGAALYPLFTYCFILTFKRGDAPVRRMAGLCGVLFAVTLTLYSAGLPFNPGEIFAFGAVIYITYVSGVPFGAAAGIFCGIAMQAEYAAFYPIAALVFGLVAEYSASAAAVAGAASGLVWAVSAGGFFALSDLLPEIVFTAAVLAPLLKWKLLPERELFLQCEAGYPGIQELRGKELERRLGKLSSSLESLSRLLYSVSDKIRRPGEAEAYRICTGVRARYCSGCVHREICTGSEAAEVQDFFDCAAYRLSCAGSVSARSVPEGLARRCYNIDAILDSMNTSAGISRKISAQTEKTELFASDYQAVADMLREAACPEAKEWARDGDAETRLSAILSDGGVAFSGVSVYGVRSKRVYLRGVGFPVTAGERDIRRRSEAALSCRLSSPEFSVDGSYVSASMHTVPKISIQSGRYASGCKREKVSGDTVSSFENEDGFYYTLVSDGMGSGREAALTSGISSVFLEKLLVGGCPMKSALEMLNCFIRGGEGECFTTVDLMEADLYTGRACFVKSGAAPSFVLRRGRVFRLHSKTVPVGIIRALDAESIAFELQSGDTVIMVSDGVTGSYEECPWLYDLLASDMVSSMPPAAAAELIGTKAAEATEGGDDITVCVMKISDAEAREAV